VGKRFRNDPNFFWVEGGDHTPTREGKPSEWELVDAVARGIREGDGGAHLQTAHWGGGTSGVQVPGAKWLDIDSTYIYSAPHTYVKTLDDFSRDEGKRPFFLIESLYENEHHATPTQWRAQMYQPILSGGAGFLFGNFPIWAFWNPGDYEWSLSDGRYPKGWLTALETPGAKDAETCGNFFSSLTWWTLRPDTSRHFLTKQEGAFGSDKYVLAAANLPGSLLAAYFPEQVKATFDLSRFPGPVQARWFDPSSGIYSDVFGSPFDNIGQKEFTPPGRNSDASSDWVLLLQSEVDLKVENHSWQELEKIGAVSWK
jgi:hypothetical protein